jgi:hypothetical protein
LIISAFLASMAIPANMNAVGQIGSMATLQYIDATYAISIIPGAAQRESAYHYYPPTIAVLMDIVEIRDDNLIQADDWYCDVSCQRLIFRAPHPIP